MTALLWGVSAVLAALFVFLGVAVISGSPARLDVLASQLRGRGTRAALLFTLSGRSRFLTVLCCALFAAFAALRLPLWIVAIVSVSQIASQTIVEICKRIFGRARPDYWLVGREAGHSYPSGHATTAVVFYGGWAIVVAAQPPAIWRDALIGCLAAWAAGVTWSRLALGAHYLSDVIGGLTFGVAWICLLLAIYLQYARIARPLLV